MIDLLTQSETQRDGEGLSPATFDLNAISLPQRHSQALPKDLELEWIWAALHYRPLEILGVQPLNNPSSGINTPPHDPQIQVGGRIDITRRQRRREQLRQKIDELLETAGVENWDSEGALAVKQETVEIAKQLIGYFPDDIEKPDVEATPRGEVDFDWILSREAMLTVSVGPSGDITFVGSFRSVDFHGTEPWTGQLPCFVHCGFEQLRSLSDI